ncbi:MAG: hypothetical protein LBQ60_03615 [Bacteroidales bacterium]|jgi:hypothetical protein|nr:hypothetical protein [Bacteroidales bacterium]
MKKFLLLLLPLWGITHLWAQDSEKEKDTEISYIPEIYGAVKAKFETSTYNGYHRFNVRNSRIGVRGLVSPYMQYRIQIDFNNEGKISILDSYASFLFGNFDLSIGQQQYKFSTDLDRGPSSNMFANRSFLSKYLTSYFGQDLADGVPVDYVGSIGSRDIGVLSRYRFSGFPVLLVLGVFNGSGSNNPEWSDHISMVYRVEIGHSKGLKGAVSHYNGATPVSNHVVETGGTYAVEEFKQNLWMWGGELHYVGDDFRIEAEYAQRRLKDEELHILTAAHVHGYYQFHIQNSAIDYIAPIARWDIGDGIEFINQNSNAIERVSTQRATIGVNLGFIQRLVGSELRFNYEKYFFRHTPSDHGKNLLFQDKFTVEIVATF